MVVLGVGQMSGEDLELGENQESQMEVVRA